MWPAAKEPGRQWTLVAGKLCRPAKCLGASGSGLGGATCECVPFPFPFSILVPILNPLPHPHLILQVSQWRVGVCRPSSERASVPVCEHGKAPD